MAFMSCMPSCDSAATACSGQTFPLKAQPRATFSSSRKSSVEKLVREVAVLACPPFEQRLGKEGCQLQVVVLRVTLFGQEPSSWLSSWGDWAISKEDALQLVLANSHDTSAVSRISTTGAELRNSHESKHMWAWRSGGDAAFNIFLNTEISIGVQKSSANTFKSATAWAQMGALKIGLQQDILPHLCTFVPGSPSYAFEAPWVSFPLTHDARPTGSIELLFRLIPAVKFDKAMILDDIRAHGAPLRHLVGHSDAVLGCAVFKCGTRMVTISGDKRGMVWDALSGAKLRELNGHTDWVQDCAVFPDGNRVITVSFDKTGIIWDAHSGAKLQELVGHNDWVKGCDVFPAGDRVVTVSFDKTGIIWNANSGVRQTYLRGHTEWINTCAAFADGERVLTGSTDRKGMIWCSRSGKMLVELVGHTDSIEGCAVFSSGEQAVTASRDKTAIIWDTRTGLNLRVLRGHGDCVQACAVFPCEVDATSLASSQESALWDGGASDNGHGRHPREKVITVSSDTKAIIWDARSGMKLQTLAGHANLLHSCAVFPTGDKVVTVSGDERGIIWDVRTAVIS